MKGFMSSSPKSTSVDTLIGRQTEILGDVRFAGGLHLDGKIKGSVTATTEAGAALSVSETGVIEGDVRVPSIVLNGVVIGDVRAAERLVLNAKARITGSVYYRLMQMESGATINGQLVHEGEPAAPVRAPGESRGDSSSVTALQDARRNKAG